MRVRVVQLLECDPRLAEGLSAEESAVAAGSLPVQAAMLKKGPWDPGPGPPEPEQLGYLVCSGLLVRRVEVDRGRSVELLGCGDLLRPWQEDASSFCRASWEILEPTTIVILGPAVARGLGRWPAIASNLIARGVNRSRASTAAAAISSIVGLEERLLILFWHLAERWGEPVTDGIRIPIGLPHRLLAELVGARRPSVTTALASLQEEGRLVSAENGCWMLRGDPPC
ncbi:MAG TPA: helix-turn-helix domain-containing protein [Solirubrobacterales bacterium]|nr:helix-turn-helix domain-containing protein [Solirubrobacterales bacterium]